MKDTDLPTLSASKLKTFKTCQRQYFLKYVLVRDKRPTDTRNMSQLLGSALHKSIEKYYKEKEDPLRTFQEYMTHMYERWTDNAEEIKGEEWYTKSFKDGKDILRKFPWDMWNPIALEQRFTLPFPNAEQPIVYINGIIDAIDISEAVLDFKSANKMPKRNELDHDPQFIIYYWAYTQLFNKPPKKIIWYHLRNQRVIEANIAHNYELKIQQLTYDIQALIQSRPFIQDHQRRNLDDVCKKQCPFFMLCYGDYPPKDTNDPIEDE